MKFVLEITCENAAFGAEPEDCAREVSRILRNAADRVDTNPPPRELILRDENGKTVGRAAFVQYR